MVKKKNNHRYVYSYYCKAIFEIINNKVFVAYSNSWVYGCGDYLPEWGKHNFTSAYFKELPGQEKE